MSNKRKWVARDSNLSEDKILQMLDDVDSNSSSESEYCSPMKEEKTSQWFTSLVQNFKSGTLELVKTNPTDERLLDYVKNADQLCEMEVKALKNVYLFWLHAKENESGLNELSDDPRTPIKRQILKDYYKMNSPSPCFKITKVDEEKMKRISFSVHFWAINEKGNVAFLLTHRMEDSYFEEVISYCRKWRLLESDITVSLLKNLWRNESHDKHFYRGHAMTGFEKEKIHCRSEKYCPFNHCSNGFLSDYDLDLMRLTNRFDVSKAIKCSSRRALTFEVENDRLCDTEGNPDSRSLESERNTVMHAQASGENTVSHALVSDEDTLKLTQVSEEDNTTYAPDSKEQPVNLNKVSKEDTEKLADVPGKYNTVDVKDTASCVKKTLTSPEGESKKPLYICHYCQKGFDSFGGLKSHCKSEHDHQLKNQKSVCPICKKEIIYLDVHIRTVHPQNRKKERCKVCGIEKSSKKSHRCTLCRFCGKEILNATRLAKHERERKCMNSLKKEHHYLSPVQTQPLDLSPSGKRVSKSSPANGKLESSFSPSKKSNDVYTAESEDTLGLIDQNVIPESSEGVWEDKDESSLTVASSDAIHRRKRVCYPFKPMDEDDGYRSEYSEYDTVEETIERRDFKDKVEKDLISMEQLENDNEKSDSLFLDKFEMYMITVSGGSDVGTVKEYTEIVKKFVLPTFHETHSPFSANWLLDCGSVKHITINEKERDKSMQADPVYLTSLVLEAIMKKVKSGSTKKKVLASIRKLMSFIELQFTHMVGHHDLGPLKKVHDFHRSLEVYIKGNAMWKSAWDEVRETYSDNQKIKDYKCPEKSLKVYEAHQDWLNSKAREVKLEEIMNYAINDELVPESESKMTELAIAIQEEIIMSNGCRPVVLRRLTMGPWADIKPGFNPREISGGDSVVQESSNNVDIRRR